MNTLNEIILEAIEESQKFHYQKKSNINGVSPQTQALTEEGREMQSDTNKEYHELREISKKISESIRTDIRVNTSKIITVSQVSRKN